ncbi:MAG: ammonium transporter [Ureaplasma sp.]|nr:ammonium transporter [Ureaplasma sp.]MDE7221825.1 ammonium transporter [Ureaplasma sp.]
MITDIGNGSFFPHQLISGELVGKTIDIPSTIVLLIATALVLLMVPGLGIFYGGLERRKNVSTIIAQSLITIPIVTLIWIFGGFSLAFGTSAGGVIGNPTDYFAFRNILFSNGWGTPRLITNITLANGVPFIVFFLFQLSFAIITPALVSGAFADRLKFRGYVLFTILFTIFIYIPVCHWIWGGGWLSNGGALDWAGGVVIHITCGAAAVSSVLVLKKRTIMNYELSAPHSLPLVSIGAALLFFGWFGFNTGGATFTSYAFTSDNILQTIIENGTLLPANNQQLWIGVNAFINSFISMSIAMLIWALIDLCFKKRISLLSILTAGIAGLATITPAAGFVPVWASLIFGFAGGSICYTMCYLNHKIHFDDALEVWPVHGIGGLVGSILVSGLATIMVNANLGTTQGLNSTNQLGSVHLLLTQLIMILVVTAWTFIFSIGIFYLAILIKGRTTKDEEIEGLDKTLLGEDSYSKGINLNKINETSIAAQDSIKTGTNKLNNSKNNSSIKSKKSKTNNKITLKSSSKNKI